MKLKRFLIEKLSHAQQEYLKRVMNRAKSKSAQDVLRKAEATAQPLPLETLEELFERYPYPPEYGYSPQATKQRGRERYRRLVKHCSKTQRFLEIGCHDGMVGYFLAGMGKRVTGVDIQSEGFDPRARKAGVGFRLADAAHLEDPDDSYDCVYSWDAFEHVRDPKAVLDEAWRVLKPGGTLYLEFGPLIHSPMGLHAYRSVPVPYCNILFTQETLDSFTRKREMKPVDFNQLNYWSLERFRALFGTLPKPYHYLERKEFGYLNLIHEYTGLFSRISRDLDEFTVKMIEGAWRKPIL